MRPAMDHLPGFWDAENWADDKWAEYVRRRTEHGTQNAIEQKLHRLLGVFMSEKKWRKREHDQWPSTSGSYDPCEDHYNYLIGAGHNNEAAELRKAAQELRPAFLSNYV